MVEPSTPWSITELAKLVEVEHTKRRLIIYSVTVVGVFFLLAFAIVRFSIESVSLGLFYLACAVVSGINLVYMQRTGRDDQALAVLNVILGALCMVLLMNGAREGVDPLYVYPVLAVGIFINRFRVAVYFAVCFMLLSGIVLFVASEAFVAATYSNAESWRLLVSLSALAGISLVTVFRHEQAKERVLDLHTQDIQNLAFYDSLTGLANRASFQRWLQKTLDRAGFTDQSLALLFIDLDNFKQVNDRHGHRTGDLLLAEFGIRLAECVRPEDGATRIWADEDVARLAGDEFVVTLTNLKDPTEAELVARRIMELFDGGFEIEGNRLPVTATIGIAVSNGVGNKAEILLNQADAAMHQAKKNGKNNVQFFSKEIARAMEQRHRIELGLQTAISESAFRLVYMPMFDSGSLEIVGVEALLRCELPELHGIGPDQFIPVAESCGLIKALDLWVIDTAMGALKRLQDQHGFAGVMCINISALELHNVDFPEQVEALIIRHRLVPSSVELEVTETSLIVDDEQSIMTLQKIRALGIGLSLDDFGTGYTAFNQLINYPVNSLKIDRSFVHGIFSQKHKRRKMAGMLQRLAQLYELRVVAEGVETAKQLKYLQRIGCDWLQGNYLSLPLDTQELIRRLEEKPRTTEEAEPNTLH